LSSNIVIISKIRTLQQAGHISRARGTRNEFRMLMWNILDNQEGDGRTTLK
jgi:hypothetical protein